MIVMSYHPQLAGDVDAHGLGGPQKSQGKLVAGGEHAVDFDSTLQPLGRDPVRLLYAPRAYPQVLLGPAVEAQLRQGRTVAGVTQTVFNGPKYATERQPCSARCRTARAADSRWSTPTRS